MARTESVQSVAGFDAVVVGSGVYAGRWLKPAKEFIERNQAALRAGPVWLFSSGPLGDPPNPDEEPAGAVTLAAAIGAKEHPVFAGSLERAGLSFAERAMVKAVHAPYGDFRDRDAIRCWAEAISVDLAHRTSA